MYLCKQVVLSLTFLGENCDGGYGGSKRIN
jgi:hypothetical protein